MGSMVLLLLWGLRMVHSGILRAFGPDLRLVLSKTLGHRCSAFAHRSSVCDPLALFFLISMMFLT
jgi:hypothetical protein